MLRQISIAAALAFVVHAAHAQASAGAPEAPKRGAGTKVLENEGIWVNKRAVAFVDDTPVRIFRPAVTATPTSAQLGGSGAPASDLWFVPASELLRAK